MRPTTYAAENYDNFSPPSTGTGDASDHSKDRVNRWEYNGLDAVTKLTALDQDGNGSADDNQVTTYLYENAYNAALVTNAIYPDSTDTDSTGSDQVKLQYGLDGLVSQRTDQRGTVIGLSYNGRRQLELQSVTTPGTGVEQSVLSIKREYDALGRLEKVTSYQLSDASGTVRNQVVFGHTDYGALQDSWQSHEGAAVTTGGSQSPKVQYGYDTDSTSGVYTDGLRLQTMTYPNGRATYYQYGLAADDLDDRLLRLSHLRQTSDQGLLLAHYSRLGSGAVVETDYDEPDLRLDLSPGGTAGQYDGLDRFGRVKDLLWRDYGAAGDAVRLKHGYDYASSRTWREDAAAAAHAPPVRWDQHYSYNGLRELTVEKQGKKGKRGQVQFAGTARRVLRTNWTCPLFPRRSTRRTFPWTPWATGPAT